MAVISFRVVVSKLIRGNLVLPLLDASLHWKASASPMTNLPIENFVFEADPGDTSMVACGCKHKCLFSLLHASCLNAEVLLLNGESLVGLLLSRSPGANTF